MRVCETFASLQGESTHAGRKCFFIRLSGCNLNCSYCDTLYGRSFDAGEERSLDSLVREALDSGLKLVEITGGEPLCSQETPALCQSLLDKGFEPEYGARPLRRAVERYLEDPLAEELLKEMPRPGTVLEVACTDNELKFSAAAVPEKRRRRKKEE